MSKTHQRIIVGSRVGGKFGPLVQNPKCLDKKRARRVRSVEIGTVVSVSGKCSWNVWADYSGDIISVCTGGLKLIDSAVGGPIVELNMKKV